MLSLSEISAMSGVTIPSNCSVPRSVSGWAPYTAASRAVVSVSASSWTISRVSAGSLEVGHLPVADLGLD